MSSTSSDMQVRSIKADQFIRLPLDKPLYLGDDAVYIESDDDGYMDLDADVGIRLNQNTAMATGKQFNGSADGVVNYSKAGAISDADFTTDTTGLVGVDTSNDRLYYRIGAADWSYISPDGGLSFPEKTCHSCGEPFKKGDIILFQVDDFAEDGAPHALPIHLRCII